MAVGAVAAFSVILGVICVKNRPTAPFYGSLDWVITRGLTLATTQISFFFLFLQMFCNSFPLEETGF